MSLQHAAYLAFNRPSGPTEAEREMARRLLEARGMMPYLDKALAMIERGRPKGLTPEPGQARKERA